MVAAERPVNKLINEKSPYLLQHAHNPVDWYPWGEEAFDRARREDKPVFLSIGYSTCHWCHVMERESFEDLHVAELLNRDFISIKVDREERPDVDSVYMSVTQKLTGSGGWPMSVFMGPDKRPFFAGTYFPINSGAYGIGFIQLLERISELWREDRERLVLASDNIVSELSEPNRQKTIAYNQTVRKGFAQLRRRFDNEHGGFGGAPKFPTPHNLMFLLRYHYAYGDSESLEMAEKTLRSMYRGGIYDHVGFGFCRYSTDNKWLVPHFEKMLYDNALLAVVYAETFQVTGDPFYKRVAEEIFEYVKRDMTSPEGAFYSAEDADSEGEEGRFYTFTQEEIIALLGADDGKKFCEAFDITEKGNFEGRNILNLIANENYEQIIGADFYQKCLRKIFNYREDRERPLRDDKILTAWNGLMIYAHAAAGRAFGNAKYISSAKTAADFILKNLTDGDGRLMTRYRDGEARFSGVAEDYAYLVMGLIALYEACFEVKYLSDAYRLNQILIDEFLENGALYQTGKHSEALISRPRELYDGATPSYNSVSIGNFIKLSHLCDEPDLADTAAEIVRFFGADLEGAPSHFCFALCEIMRLTGLSRQIIISGGPAPDVEFLNVINGVFQPFTTLARVNPELSKQYGFYRNYESGSGKTAVYLCEGTRCEPPILDADKLREKLQEQKVLSER